MQTRTFSFETHTPRKPALSKAKTSSSSDALKNMPMQCWRPSMLLMGLMRLRSSIVTTLPLSSLLRPSARLMAVCRVPPNAQQFSCVAKRCLSHLNNRAAAS